MEPVEVRELGPGQLVAAASVVGRGMRDNPLHVRAFGHRDERRERALSRFFFPVLSQYLPKGTILGAFRAGRLVGVCGMLSPGHCQPTFIEKIRLLPAVMRSAPRSLVPVLRWTGEWRRRDLRRPHCHLGPIAVERDLQGGGIGTAMLTECCRRIDALGATAYLETDKAKNVTFYEHFDFETRGQTSVIGVPNWFMVRAGRGRRSSA